MPLVGPGFLSITYSGRPYASLTVRPRRKARFDASNHARAIKTAGLLLFQENRTAGSRRLRRTCFFLLARSELRRFGPIGSPSASFPRPRPPRGAGQTQTQRPAPGSMALRCWCARVNRAAARPPGAASLFDGSAKRSTPPFGNQSETICPCCRPVESRARTGIVFAPLRCAWFDCSIFLAVSFSPAEAGGRRQTWRTPPTPPRQQPPRGKPTHVAGIR